jgi:hypothetical protein
MGLLALRKLRVNQIPDVSSRSWWSCVTYPGRQP